MSHERFVSLDPGSNATGWAWWEGGELYGGGVVRGTAGSAVDTGIDAGRVIQRHAGAVAFIIYERMAIYKFTSQRGDQNDLIPLAEIAGAACGALGARGEPVLARTWKGQVPKDVCHARCRSRLNERELRHAVAAEEIVIASLRHNFWDAIGIGLWKIGRLW